MVLYKGINIKKIASAFAVCLLFTACSTKREEVEDKVVVDVTPGSSDDFKQTESTIVYFDYDKHTLTESEKAKLDSQAEWMKKYPDVRFVIEGNCDSRGTPEYNIGLGERRANFVREYLVSQGVSRDRLEIKSNGKALARNVDSEEEHQKDRNATTVSIAS